MRLEYIERYGEFAPAKRERKMNEAKKVLSI